MVAFVPPSGNDPPFLDTWPMDYNLHSAAIVTVFACNLVHSYKFQIFQKTAWEIFLYIWQSQDVFQELWKISK